MTSGWGLVALRCVSGVEAVASGIQASMNGGASACGNEAGVFGEERDRSIMNSDIDRLVHQCDYMSGAS